MAEPARKTSLRLADAGSCALPRKFRFTRARLDEVKVTAGKDRVYVHDADCPGLTYMKAAGGTEKFYFYRKINGQPRRYPIANGNVSVDDARKLVRAELTEYAKGNDIRARRLEERKQLSLQQLFLQWRSVEGGKKRSIGQYEDLFDKYAAPLVGRKVNSIQQHEVAALHARIGTDNGPYVANRTLAVLSIVFRWAAHYGINNPVKGIKRFPEHARERFLQPGELVRFYAAIESEPDPTWKDFWKLLLYTGARRDNVGGMAWADVDLHARVWRIPSHSAKGKKMIAIPLGEEAVAVLRKRLEAQESEQYVFPSHGKSGRITDPKIAWRKLLARAKITDLRIHDVRRTVGSYLAQAGVSDRLIGGILGQTTQQATNVYARLRAEPVREAMAVGAMAMEAARQAAIAEAEAAEKKRSAKADDHGKRA